MATYRILIMGASYASLLASKLLLAGHSVKRVCLPVEADLINSEGFRVRMPVKGRKPACTPAPRFDSCPGVGSIAHLF
jgi:hypothetical protein